MLTLKRIIEFKYRKVKFKYQVVEIDCCEDVLVFVDVLRLKVEEVGFFDTFSFKKRSYSKQYYIRINA